MHSLRRFGSPVAMIALFIVFSIIAVISVGEGFKVYIVRRGWLTQPQPNVKRDASSTILLSFPFIGQPTDLEPAALGDDLRSTFQSTKDRTSSYTSSGELLKQTVIIVTTTVSVPAEIGPTQPAAHIFLQDSPADLVELKDCPSAIPPKTHPIVCPASNPTDICLPSVTETWHRTISKCETTRISFVAAMTVTSFVCPTTHPCPGAGYSCSECPGGWFCPPIQTSAQACPCGYGWACADCVGGWFCIPGPTSTAKLPCAAAMSLSSSLSVYPLSPDSHIQSSNGYLQMSIAIGPAATSSNHFMQTSSAASATKSGLKGSVVQLASTIPLASFRSIKSLEPVTTSTSSFAVHGSITSGNHGVGITSGLSPPPVATGLATDIINHVNSAVGSAVTSVLSHAASNVDSGLRHISSLAAVIPTAVAEVKSLVDDVASIVGKLPVASNLIGEALGGIVGDVTLIAGLIPSVVGEVNAVVLNLVPNIAGDLSTALAGGGLIQEIVNDITRVASGVEEKATSIAGSVPLASGIVPVIVDDVKSVLDLLGGESGGDGAAIVTPPSLPVVLKSVGSRPPAVGGNPVLGNLGGSVLGGLRAVRDINAVADGKPASTVSTVVVSRVTEYITIFSALKQATTASFEISRVKRRNASSRIIDLCASNPDHPVCEYLD